MELTPGFKLSEAGPIPEDWEAVALGSVAAKTRNAIVGGPFGSDLTAEDYRDSGVPVIRGSNMHGRKVGGPFVYVEAAKAKALEANLARRGDIVFTQRGTLGQIALVPFDGYAAYLVSQSQMKASLDLELCDAEFVIHIFEQPEYQRKIVASAIQTGVPHLNLGILREYLLPQPPLPEQQAIARVLGDVDAWIAAAEAEAAKLASVKAAAMDALLTPTTRLPGFEGKWERCRFGDVAQTRNQKVQTRDNWAARTCVDLEQIVSKEGRVAAFIDVSADWSSRYAFEAGDILFGRLRAYLENTGMPTGPGYARLRFGR